MPPDLCPSSRSQSLRPGCTQTGLHQDHPLCPVLHNMFSETRHSWKIRRQLRTVVYNGVGCRRREFIFPLLDCCESLSKMHLLPVYQMPQSKCYCTLCNNLPGFSWHQTQTGLLRGAWAMEQELTVQLGSLSSWEPSSLSSVWSPASPGSWVI